MFFMRSHIHVWKMAWGVGIMAKVLSLMETHSDDRSRYFLSAAEIDDQLSNIEEKKKDAGNQFRGCVTASTPCITRVQRRR